MVLCSFSLLYPHGCHGLDTPCQKKKCNAEGSVGCFGCLQKCVYYVFATESHDRHSVSNKENLIIFAKEIAEMDAQGLQGLKDRRFNEYSNELVHSGSDSDDSLCLLTQQQFHANFEACRDFIARYVVFSQSANYQEWAELSAERSRQWRKGRKAQNTMEELETPEDFQNWYTDMRSLRAYSRNEDLLRNGNPHDLLVFIYWVLAYPEGFAAFPTDGSIDMSTGVYTLTLAASSALLHCLSVAACFRLLTFYNPAAEAPTCQVTASFWTRSKLVVSPDDSDEEEDDTPVQQLPYNEDEDRIPFTLSTNPADTEYHPISIHNREEQDELQSAGLYVEQIRKWVQDRHDTQLIDRQRCGTIEEQDSDCDTPDDEMIELLDSMFDDFEGKVPEAEDNKWYRRFKDFVYTVYNKPHATSAEQKTRVTTAIVNGCFNLRITSRMTIPFAHYVKCVCPISSRSPRNAWDPEVYNILMKCFGNNVDARFHWERMWLGYSILFDGCCVSSGNRIQLTTALTPGLSDDEEGFHEFLATRLNAVFGTNTHVKDTTNRRRIGVASEPKPIATLTSFQRQQVEDFSRLFYPHIRGRIGGKKESSWRKAGRYTEDEDPVCVYSAMFEEVEEEKNFPFLKHPQVPHLTPELFNLTDEDMVRIWPYYRAEMEFYFRRKPQDEALSAYDIIVHPNGSVLRLGWQLQASWHYLKHVITRVVESDPEARMKNLVMASIEQFYRETDGRFRQQIVDGEGNVDAYEQLLINDIHGKIRTQVNIIKREKKRQENLN